MAVKLARLKRDQMKARRLVMIRERYRKLILEPRREVELEIFGDRDLEELELEVAD